MSTQQTAAAAESKTRQSNYVAEHFLLKSYTHEPLWCPCRSRSFLWAAQRGVWTGCGQSLVSGWSAPHSYCVKTKDRHHHLVIFSASDCLYEIQRWSYFAMVMRPTLFSGLLRVLEWHTMLTASCWACSLVGRKSPFLIYSLLSTLRGKYKFNAAAYTELTERLTLAADMSVPYQPSLVLDILFPTFPPTPCGKACLLPRGRGKQMFSSCR